MSFHINLFVIDHFEMAPDVNGLSSCFLKLCAKALVKTYTYLENFDFHLKMLLGCLRARSGLSRAYIIRIYSENGASAKTQILHHLSFEERILKAQHSPLQIYWRFPAFANISTRLRTTIKGIMRSIAIEKYVL